MSDPTEVEGVEITGKRRYWGTYTGPSIVPPSPPLPGSDIELSPDEPAIEESPEDKEKKECGAKGFKDELDPYGRNAREYISFTYKKNGNIYSTELRTEGGSGFSQSFLEGLMSEFGFGRADVLGVSHNHNSSGYCNSTDTQTRNYQERDNRYPSGNDWNMVDWLLQGGASEAELTLYLMGCSGDAIRGFNANMRSFYRGLTPSQKQAGVGLPPEITGPPCEPEEE